MKLLTPLVIAIAMISTSAMAQESSLTFIPTTESVNTLDLGGVSKSMLKKAG